MKIKQVLPLHFTRLFVSLPSEFLKLENMIDLIDLLAMEAIEDAN